MYEKIAQYPQKIQVVTSLPSVASDGDQVVLVDSASAPTYSWLLQYVAAKSSNKWVFVGGPPIITAPAGSLTTTSTSYVDLTSGPTITIPLAGLYVVHFQVQAARSGGGTVDDLVVIINGTTSGNGAATPRATITDQFNSGVIGSSESKTFVASETLKIKVRVTTGATSSTFDQGILILTPVAIGG